MYETVVTLLDRLGYTVINNDQWMINFLIDKNENYVLASCHIDDIPNELTPKIAEKIAGEFLNYKKDIGELTDIYDLQPAIKSIKEGDTQINYAIGEGSSTPEKRLDNLINQLTNNFERFISNYRCVKW